MKALSWSVEDKHVYLLALLVRVVFILIGEWQDRNLSIPYTDVDYEVMSDAATLIANRDSPYARATYRYSPLLAYLLLPNVVVHRCWGKIVFSVADLAVGKCLQSILSRQGLQAGRPLQYASLWLLNPLSINVSTRGSFDSVTSALVLGVTSALLEGSLWWAGVVFGVVVHLRVYPIIYAPAFALHLSRPQGAGTNQGGALHGGVKAVIWSNLFGRRPLLFAFISAFTFLACTAACARAYGLEFIHNALLYHLTRTDNRHNYSIYWYWIYLDYGSSHRWFLGLAAFVPQAVMLLATSVILHGDLALCVFAQTALFVFFNKVFTGQYITWYLCLVPLLAPRLTLGRRKGSLLLASWVCALLWWLFIAWNLEMRGENVYLALWIGSVVIFAANIVVLNVSLRACYDGGSQHRLLIRK